MKEVWIFFIFQSLTCADRVNSCCALWSVDVLVYSCDQWSYLRINCLATLSFTWRRYRTLPSCPVQMLKELHSNFYHVHFSMWRDDSVQESMKPSDGVSVSFVLSKYSVPSARTTNLESSLSCSAHEYVHIDGLSHPCTRQNEIYSVSVMSRERRHRKAGHPMLVTTWPESYRLPSTCLDWPDHRISH
jgi:hypothetical protein